MIYFEGIKGGINYMYGGEIDVLLMIFDLLGIKNKGYIQFGMDLLLKQYNQIVVFWNGDFVLLIYMKISGIVYDLKIGKKLMDMMMKQKDIVKQM